MIIARIIRAAHRSSIPLLAATAVSFAACDDHAKPAPRTPAETHAATPPPPPPPEAPHAAADTSPTASAASGTEATASPPPKKEESFAEWLTRHMPEGGFVEAGAGSDAPKVKYKVGPKDTAQSVAKAFLPVSDTYYAEELARQIVKANKGFSGTIEIPHIVPKPYSDDPKTERLGWPEDKALKGVFVTGPYAGIRWVDVLDKSAEHGFNAVVLDAKDYEGGVNYPSKAKIAVETNATHIIYIPDLARAIRFAHWRGIRVIMRIPCFHDPWAQDHATRLAIKGTWGGPFKMGWMDPMNEEARSYVLELVQEQIDAGADEVQLDYIRFPVHAGTDKAVLPKRAERQEAIRGFVHRVHEVTSKQGVPLSLDLFGVVTQNDKRDQELLGQDIGVLAPECEAISPMIYPSHYSAHYAGFEHPGDHAEIHGWATKGGVEKLPPGSTTVIRSWLQAFPQDSPNFGPKYVADAARFTEQAGGTGWLMWHPGCEYSSVWAGFPKKK
jgi:hypothetical protein